MIWVRVGGIACVIALVLMAGYGLYGHGYSVAETEWQARWAEQGEFQAKAMAAAERAARVEEQRQQTAINQVAQDAGKHNQVAATDATAADVAGQRLHDTAKQLATRASSACSDSDAAQRGQAAARAAMVLSDLFRRADQRAGELAAAYDRARIAGLACESAYSSLFELPMEVVN